MIIEVTSVEEMQVFGQKLGGLLNNNVTIELIGDVGAGKTTLVKGIAKGMRIDETIQSPTFTISRLYETETGRRLAHYDFYRLHDAGIMKDEINEVLHDDRTVTIVEWGDAVAGVLPQDRLTVTINALNEDSRKLALQAGGEKSRKFLEALR